MGEWVGGGGGLRGREHAMNQKVFRETTQRHS